MLKKTNNTPVLKTELLKEVYDERSKSSWNNFVLWIRAEYYQYIIIPTIQKYLEETSINQSSIIYGTLLERGSGQGHKMKKTVESLLGTKFDFYGIEPSAGMRGIAEEKFQGDDRIKFIEGFAQDLPFENNSIDFIFDIQMQHHHTDEIKKEMIEEAYRVLKPGGNIYILDTYVPEGSNLISKIQRKVFAILQSGYVNSVKKGIYHNGFFTDTKTMLSSSGFEVNEDYSQGYKVFLGHILGFDFINQAIATKK